jgi:transcriptional regulator with XRE-family HTH domain
MGDLTFGEQVKIMLSRKNMTIKQLAEMIEERTGKAMSRQNLTQRLSRDNFQEQDMRLIAAILGCPFKLSIFPEELEIEETASEELAVQYANNAGLKNKDAEEMTVEEPESEEPESETEEAEELETEEAEFEEVDDDWMKSLGMNQRN